MLRNEILRYHQRNLSVKIVHRIQIILFFTEEMGKIEIENKNNVKNNFTEETGEKKDDKNNDNNNLKRWERIKERTNLTIITI